MAAQGSRRVCCSADHSPPCLLTRPRARSFRAAAVLAERAAAAQRDAFSALLARVLGALPPSGTPLSPHELAASAAALGLQPQELAALAEGCAAAFRRAAAEGYNPQARSASSLNACLASAPLPAAAAAETRLPQALGDYVAAEGGSAAVRSAVAPQRSAAPGAPAAFAR